MNRDQFFKVVKAYNFFETYCPKISNFQHKLRGFDGNKKPIDFTDEDKKIMKEAAAKLGGKFNDVKF
jgi:hypothetical protein